MASFFPKKLSSRKIDFSSEKATVKVSIYLLLVIATPNGNALAMECAHNMKTRILCSSVFEESQQILALMTVVSMKKKQINRLFQFHSVKYVTIRAFIWPVFTNIRTESRYLCCKRCGYLFSFYYMQTLYLTSITCLRRSCSLDQANNFTEYKF